MKLESLGWTQFFAEAFLPLAERGLSRARVIAEARERYRLLTFLDGASAEPCGVEHWGELTGALRYRAETRLDLPMVGDWVAFQELPGEAAIVHAVLPRRTLLARRAAGRRTELQGVGANVDTVFVVSSLNGDLNPRRLERYLALARQGGVEPVIVLSKADLAGSPAGALEAIQHVMPNVATHVVSAVTGVGLDALDRYLGPGKTVALLGSSGVGKSTLVNRLLGEERQAVREIRDTDDRGRHTTTARELILLNSGALLLDTPGMRELGLAGDGDALDEVFDDIVALARECRFGDCRHRGEPGCAVEQALVDGRLDPERKRAYDKLASEEAWMADRLEGGAAFAEKKRWKAIHARLKK